ncbi:MAG: SOS response-associated peptidase [Flavobacteriales bacterium]|nr:SOS response-associated peptidase [Flavobacteriales bacterium]
MCYTIQQLEERIRKQGLRNQNSPEEIERALQLFRRQMSGEPMFLLSGFDHPLLWCIHREGELVIEKMSWGLIPSWNKDLKEALKMRNMTLNARGESLFEKKSFKIPAQRHRCLLPVTGFYEYQHVKGKNYPYFIDWADESLRLLACVYDVWNNPATGAEEKTFAIVTTKGNPLMATIHNNPELDEPRMPLVLSGNDLLTWLDPDASEDQIKALIKPSSDEDMKAHTVRPLRGKSAAGNTALASEKYVYPELNPPLTLF